MVLEKNKANGKRKGMISLYINHTDFIKLTERQTFAKKMHKSLPAYTASVVAN